MRFPVVLFDLDGTLIDSIELILNSARHAFQHTGRAIPPDEEWLAGVGTPLVSMFRKYASDDTDIDALIAKYREYQLEHHDRLTRCYDQVVDTVDRLRAAGHPLAIVTSKTCAMAGRGLDHVGLAAHFDVIVGCDICERHKPDPEPVHRALELLAYAPHEAVFIGDSVHDMLAGNAAGVTTIAALWGPFSRDSLAGSAPAHYLERVSDVPSLLARIEGARNSRP
jgi:pyrophosphatase PpaX